MRGLAEREMSRFLNEPATVRNAARVIVIGTAVVVVLSGLAIRLLDPSEFSNIWVGMWWAVQTVTTVGYGDVTPHQLSGRIVGVVVMLWGVAFVTILVAAITSTFIRRASGEQHAAEQLDAISSRLDRIESLLRLEARGETEEREERRGAEEEGHLGDAAVHDAEHL
jgi:voltage-gated potassium channel